MSKTVSARCGFCGKGFRLLQEQLGHEVRCPHCKTICKILAQTEAAREAVEALKPQLEQEHARPVTAHRHVVMPTGGLRHKSLAILWAVLLVLVLGGLIVAGVVLWTRSPGPGMGPGAPQGAAPSPYPYASAGGSTTAGRTPGAPNPAAPIPEPVTVEIDRLVSGIRRGARTYAAGTVTNQTREILRAVEVEVAILGKDDQELGRAHAQVRDLGPGETAPVAAVWDHDPSVIGVKFVPGYVVGGENPPGPPQRLEVEGDPWPMADPGSFANTGKVCVEVANRGVQAVEAVEVTVVMRGEDGGVVGAAHEVVLSRIMPGKSAEIEIPYEQCPSRLIRLVQVRAQAAQP